jgi:signal peptidase
LLNKKKSGLPVAVKDIIIVVVGVAVVWTGLWIALGTKNPFYVVSSESMVPVLKVNDVLVVRDGSTWDNLKVGDIIVFNQPDGEGKVIVHRVAEIATDDNGQKVIRTKGDANPGSIPGTDYPITKTDYIGKVVYVLPGVGYVTKIISPPVNYIIIAIILAILFFNRMGRRDKGGGKEPPSSSDTQPSSSSPSSSPDQPPS